MYIIPHKDQEFWTPACVSGCFSGSRKTHAVFCDE